MRGKGTFEKEKANKREGRDVHYTIRKTSGIVLVVVIAFLILLALVWGLVVLPNYGYTRAQLKDEMTVEVGSASALAEALRVNSQTKNQKVTIRLTKDIVLSQKDRERITSQGAVFYGVLDGNGHGISCSDAIVGDLFTLNGSLSDLTLSGCTLSVTQESATEGLSTLRFGEGAVYYGLLSSFLAQDPTVPQEYETFVGWYVVDGEKGKILLTNDFAEGEYDVEAVFARKATFESGLAFDDDTQEALSVVKYYSSDLFGTQNLPTPVLREQSGWTFDGWWTNDGRLPAEKDTGKIYVSNADLAGALSARWIKPVTFGFAESALRETQAALSQEDRILLPQERSVAYGESFLPAAPQNLPEKVTFEGYCCVTISQTGETILQNYAQTEGYDGSFDRLLARFSIKTFLVIGDKVYTATLPYCAETEAVDLSAIVKTHLDDKWEAVWRSSSGENDESVIKKKVDEVGFSVTLQRRVKLHFVLDEYGDPTDRYAEVVAKYGSTLSTVDLKDQTGTSVIVTSNGHRFAGWYANAEYSGDPVSLDDFTANLSDLYAKWESA